MKTIVVHNATFHADDALTCFLLLNTEEFAGSNIVRTRDPEIIEKADVVADVGGVYDHEKRRYDHHQPSFQEKFPGSDIPCAAAGIVYFHFGKEVITNILKKNEREAGEHLEYLYNEMYSAFVKEVDAIDNGVNMFPPEVEPTYSVKTGISSRIAILNPHWKSVGVDEMERFKQAIDLIGKEFTERLIYIFDSQIPAIDIVKKAFAERFNVDESGRIMVLPEMCPFDKHMKRYEDEDETKPKVFYVISPRIDGSFNVKAVGTGKGFELRKPLPFAGLRDEELSNACGIEGGIFVHKSGFLGGFKKQEQAIQFAKYAVARPLPEEEKKEEEKKEEEKKE